MISTLCLCRVLFFLVMYFFEGGCSDNDWAIAYSYCFLLVLSYYGHVILSFVS
uniref:Uncharacterized protein n=2 Tax=unclassified Gammacoronavirus TaxID=1433214 RepID=A0AB39AF08_9GAMC